jgi:hypothetical protein
MARSIRIVPIEPEGLRRSAAVHLACFDESLTRLIGEIREPIAAEPGQPKRSDREYSPQRRRQSIRVVDDHKIWRHRKLRIGFLDT